MKKYGASALLVILLLLVKNGSSQDIVSFHDIVFKSEFEKKIFDDHFNHKKSDYFLLFMAGGDLLTESSIQKSKEKFYQHLEAIGKEKLDQKKNDKKIKQVYEDLHKTFLSKYEERNQFENIFHNGSFNCVSSSALFSLAFEHFRIPYSIKEKPTHVYLLAYPGSEQIIVETTSPVRGYNTVSDAFKQAYLKTLKDQKLISAQEYANTDKNALFDKHYFGSQENISLGQLVGIQYLNLGLENMEQNNYLEALHQLEKAYLFYPSNRIGYCMMGAAQQLFLNHDQKDLMHAQALAKLSRFQQYGMTSEVIRSEFAQSIQRLLFNDGQKEKLAAYYQTLDSLITNTDLKNELGFMYQYESGRYFFNQGKYKDALPYFIGCVKIKPESQDALNLIIACISHSLSNKSNPEIIRSLEDYSTRYPGLATNDRFNAMLASTYLTEFGMNFETSNAVSGEKYRSVFENFFREHPDLSLDMNLIGQAYSAAAVYYFKKGNTAKSKTILAKGLEVSPGNYELLRRKEMIR
jgi:tetratricopeptide (TPR) repeat protein